MHAMAEKPGLTPRFSWAPPQFVALPENRSAFIAVRRLARCLGQKRCPFAALVLHGPPGCGKSHLAGALHDFAEDHYSSLRVNAGDWPRWNDDAPPENLGGCDLLTVEDLQHLPSWAADALAELLDRRAARRRATIVTASKSPMELGNLPARLRSRLSAGLIIGIESLTAPSRRKLLGKLVQGRAAAIRDDALDWLAANIPGSVRQLRAAANRLNEFASASAQPIDEVRVRALLQPDSVAQQPAIERIVRLIALRFDVEVGQVRGPDRHPNLVWPRQLSMHLARSLTTLSLAQIGEYFRRDHSTVRHACRKVDEALAADASLPGLLRELRAELS